MCLGQGADLHMAQLMPLPFTVPGSPKQSPAGCKTVVIVVVVVVVVAAAAAAAAAVNGLELAQ